MRSLYTYLLLLISLSAYCQDKILDSSFLSIKYNYFAKRDLLDPERVSTSHMSLLIGDQWTLFYNYHNELAQKYNSTLPPEKRYGITVTKPDGTFERKSSQYVMRKKGLDESYYINRNENIHICVSSIYFTGLSKYSESYEVPAWHITEETKVFETIECQKAECDFRGRKWIAWFAYDIPVSSGPWLLSGLPGLIVEAYDSNMEFVFQLTEIQELTSSVKIILKDPIYYTTRSKKDHMKLLNSRFNNGLPNLLINGEPIKRKWNPIEK